MDVKEYTALAPHFFGAPVRQMSGSVGCELQWVDTTQPNIRDAALELLPLLARYGVVMVRGMSLQPEEMVQLGGRLGHVLSHPYLPTIANEPRVIRLVKEAQDFGPNVGGGWHNDLTYMSPPGLVTMLQAVELPRQGGDTCFASAKAAFRSLSPAYQAFLRGLTTINRRVHDELPKSASLPQTRPADAPSVMETRYPLVATIPETGEETLYFNPVLSRLFEQLGEEESRSIADFLSSHIVRPEFSCRYRWSVGDVLMWDNRQTVHLAVNDFHGFRREMWRLTTTGLVLGPIL